MARPVPRRYVRGPGVDDPIVVYDGGITTTKRWFYRNWQGSIIAEADASGSASTPYTYGPYGEPGEVVGPLFRYTGQILDEETELYYYKARYYSPALGRFLQTDPIGYQDDLNLYAYVGNDPVNLADPTGQAAETVLDVTSLIVGGASFVDNVGKGNVGAALLDAAGVVVDAAAVAVPFVPGGASLGIKLVREGGKKAPDVVSRIKDNKGLVREAQKAGRNADVQKDIDNLTGQLKDGNMNPGIGSKSVGDGVSEARGRKGGRVFFREKGGKVEILGKSSKENQRSVIEKIKEHLKGEK